MHGYHLLFFLYHLLKALKRSEHLKPQFDCSYLLVKPHGRLHLFRRPLSCPGLPKLPHSTAVSWPAGVLPLLSNFVNFCLFSSCILCITSSPAWHLTPEWLILRLPTKASPVTVSQSVLGRTFVDQRDNILSILPSEASNQISQIYVVKLYTSGLLQWYQSVSVVSKRIQPRRENMREQFSWLSQLVNRRNT